MSRTFAIIENGIVANVIVADEWPGGIDVTDLTPRPGPGWTFADGVFTAPPVVVEPEPVTTTPYMTHFGFLSRLSSKERTAVRNATASDPVLDDAMFLFNSAERIDVTLPETQMLVGYLAMQGYVAPERVPELLAPIPLSSPHAKT